MKKHDSKLSWFPFYPADWRNDLELQSCSYGARGLWIEIMCLMHNPKAYGYVFINNQKLNENDLNFDSTSHQLCTNSAPTSSQLMVKTVSTLTHGSVKLFRLRFKELVNKGVIRTDENGDYFSERMVKDQRFREKCRVAGKKGGNPKITGKGLTEPLTHGLTPPLNPGVKVESRTPARKEFRGKSLEVDTPLPPKGDAPPAEFPEKPNAGKNEIKPDRENEFNEFWQTYPKRHGSRGDKQKAIKKFNEVPKRDIPALMAGAQKHVEYIAYTEEYPKNAETWLHQKKWNQYLNWVKPEGEQASGRRGQGTSKAKAVSETGDSWLEKRRAMREGSDRAE